jgi:hypothetical protein
MKDCKNCLAFEEKEKHGLFKPYCDMYGVFLKSLDCPCEKMDQEKKYKVEVKTGSDPKWYSNAMRYDSLEEAQAAAADLASRWLLVVDHRAVEAVD